MSEPALTDPSVECWSLALLAQWAREQRNISEAFVTVMAESASICLNAEKHKMKCHVHVQFEDCIAETLTNLQANNYQVQYLRITNVMRNTYEKEEEAATEDGAYGMALLMIKATRGLSFITRSQRKTGFDYWIGSRESTGANLFKNKSRLEVSGIRNGDGPEITKRKRNKIVQTKQSDHKGLPAYVAVVEFGRPGVHFVYRQVGR